MRVRELAAWGLDANEYRPPCYRGDPDRARVLAARRSFFEETSALIDSVSPAFAERFAGLESRSDLHAEMAGLDWFLGIVDLRLLLAFQRRIIFDSETVETPVAAKDDWEGLVQLCFGHPKPVVCDAFRTAASVSLSSANPNLNFLITENSSSPIAVHSGSPFFEVAQYRNRWFLRDGYHRAFRCLQSGVVLLPAVIVRARTLEELGADQAGFFCEQVLLSETPPRVADFLNDALVIEYRRAPLIKTLRITVEETYTLQEDNL